MCFQWSVFYRSVSFLSRITILEIDDIITAFQRNRLRWCEYVSVNDENGWEPAGRKWLKRDRLLRSEKKTVKADKYGRKMLWTVENGRKLI